MALQPLPDPGPIGDDELRIVEPLCAVFRKKLKAEGLKYTPERARILDAIIRFEGLFEAERLQVALGDGGRAGGAGGRGGGVSKATVYRTIKLLQEAGIIQRIPVDGDQAHFQLVYGTRPNDLLIRLDTDEAIPIEVPELAAIRDRICRERGLVAQGHRLLIFAVGGKGSDV